MKPYKKITTLAAAAGLLVTTGTASAAITITDAVPTSANNPFGSASLGSGVTVTGSGVRTELTSSGNVDPTVSPWNGNGYTYRPTSGSSPGSVTYAAATGDYFTDFAAQIVVHKSIIGSTAADALGRFTFESSTNGSTWSTFSVTGVAAGLGGAGIADWNHVDVSTTALDALTDISHLRVTISPLASGGATWHQQLGSVSMDVVVVVPEPSSTALLGLGGLALILRRRRA
jgi:hypothetical protein